MRRSMLVVLSVLAGVAAIAPSASAIPDDPDPATAGAELNGKIVTIVTTSTSFTITLSGFCGTSSVTISANPAIAGLPTTVTTSTTGVASVTLPLPTTPADYVITATANPANGAPAICAGAPTGTLALDVASGAPTTTVTATTVVSATTTTQVASAAPGGQLPVGGNDASTPLQIATVSVLAGGGLIAIAALRRRRVRVAHSS